MHIEEQRVWSYLIKNRKATPEQVAHKTGATLELVKSCMSRISSDNWRDEVSIETKPVYETLSARDVLVYRLIKAVQSADTVTLREVADKLGVK